MWSLATVVAWVVAAKVVMVEIVAMTMALVVVVVTMKQQ